MDYGLMGVAALALIVLFVAMIKPHGKHKDKQSKYSQTDLFTLGLAAVLATVILIMKFA
jgi:zinc transporter ZupT